MKAKLTKRFLNSLGNDTGKDRFIFDTDLPGFGVKVTPKGTISFIVNARIKHGVPKRTTIGPYPLFSVSAARDKAQAVLRLYREGIDPIKQARALRQEEVREKALNEALGVTLGAVFEDYLTARDLKPRTAYDYRNTVKNCFADWLDRPVREITRRDVEEKFRFIQANNRRTAHETGKAQATKAMRILSTILNFAMAEEIEGQRLLVENPVEVLAQKKIDRTVKPRVRYLGHEALWMVVRTIECMANTAVRDWLLLLLYSGIRRNEGLSLPWKNVNLDLKYFVVEDTKNRLDHVVPMSGSVFELFSNRKEASSNSPWVFPATRGAGHLQEPRRQIALVAETCGVPFTAHDLRRTFASVAYACGLNPITIKRVMNHKTRDVTEKYIQAEAEQLRKPMEEIAHYIHLMVFHGEREWIEKNLGEKHFQECYCS